MEFHEFFERYKAFLKTGKTSLVRADSTEEHDDGGVVDESQQKVLEAFGRRAILYGLYHGISILRDPASVRSAELVPLSVLPTTFPRSQFDLAVSLSPTFNKLISLTTTNADWLYSTLEKVISLDTEFTGKLADIAKRVYGTGPSQRDIKKDLRLILLRSDYMLDIDPCTMRSNLSQVEFNTIALSFAPLAQSLSEFHRMVMKGSLNPDIASQAEQFEVPNNFAFDAFVKAFIDVDALYRKKNNVRDYDDVIGTCVVMIVSDVEKNVFDQQAYAAALARHGIHTIRLTFQEVYQSFLNPSMTKGLHFRSKNEAAYTKASQLRRAFYPDDLDPSRVHEISIVYYRTGYNPEDYISGAAWEMRELLEHSEAVICPNVLTHLSGVKALQSVYKNYPEELIKLGLTSAEVEAIAQTFADQVYISDDPESMKHPLIEKALQNPDGYLLKPQREGGLHNIAGKDVHDNLMLLQTANLDSKLENLSKAGGYLLMKRFNPPKHHIASFKLHSESVTPSVVSSVSELGCFSVYIADSDVVHENAYAGYLLRSKGYANIEGGVAVGAAVLDSPLLYEEFPNGTQ